MLNLLLKMGALVVLSCSSLTNCLVADECEQSDEPFSWLFLEYCPDGAPDHLILSHTEGKGLGYTQGYTSLELFLSQPFCQNQIVPFADLRGHVFNNGRYAANAGLGMRLLDDGCHRIWGVSGFYDYLQTSHRSYHQLSLGLEALSETWDVRLNGYLPIGKQRTSLYEFIYDDLSPTGFLLKGREEFAMKGVDAEIGYHFFNNECLDLYAGAGPYAYWGQAAAVENAFTHKDKYAIGGRIRAYASLFNFVSLDVVTTYDAQFQWTGQVTLALMIPFDFKFNLQGWNDTYSPIEQRSYQPIIRNEIIVTERINRYSRNPEVLNPEFEP